ncbi:MAG TPA: hypothetical protein VMR95_01415 [Candidatus Binatia bacterium]|nr:hypothetical protein [Candidatus Binatia bacterium]
MLLAEGHYGSPTLEIAQFDSTGYMFSNNIVTTLPNVQSNSVLVLIFLNNGNSNVPTGVSGGSATWTQKTSVTYAVASALQIWVGTGTTGGSVTIGASTSSVNRECAILLEVRNSTAPSSPVDVCSSNNAPGNYSSGTTTSPNATPTHEPAIVIAAGVSGSNDVTAQPASPWQSIANLTTSGSVVSLTDATETLESAQWSSGSDMCTGIIALH